VPLRYFGEQEKIIGTLLNLDFAYGDNLDYPFPPQHIVQGDGKYNSNSYISGLLQAAGIGLPPLFDVLDLPGAEKPVPRLYFQ
jgi:hypothetical protein